MGVPLMNEKLWGWFGIAVLFLILGIPAIVAFFSL